MKNTDKQSMGETREDGLNEEGSKIVLDCFPKKCYFPYQENG